MQKAKVVLAVVASLASLSFVASWPIKASDVASNLLTDWMMMLADNIEDAIWFGVGTGDDECYGVIVLREINRPIRYMFDFLTEWNFRFLLNELRRSMGRYQDSVNDINQRDHELVTKSLIGAMKACSRIFPSIPRILRPHMSKPWASLDPKKYTRQDFYVLKDALLYDTCMPRFLKLHEGSTCTCSEN